MRKLPCVLLFFALAVISLCACDKYTPVVSNIDPPLPAVIPEPPPNVLTDEQPLHIVLLPVEPTASSALYARVSGAREPVRIRWLKNGQTIEGEENVFLAAEYLTRGDAIEVEVVSGVMRGSATVVISNSPPAISAVKLNCGSVVTVEPKGEDPDGDAISYRYQWLVNDTEVFSETTHVLPAQLFARGDRVTVAITPYDAETGGVTVRVKDVLIDNKPPVITSSPPTGFEDGQFDYTVTAEDPEGEPLSYSLETAPEEMMIDSQTGALLWRIGEDVTGSHLVKIKVEDASGRWIVQELSLDIQHKSGERSR